MISRLSRKQYKNRRGFVLVVLVTLATESFAAGKKDLAFHHVRLIENTIALGTKSKKPAVIRFELSADAIVELLVRDANGVIVFSSQSKLLAGENALIWNGETLAGKIVLAGVYYYELKASNSDDVVLYKLDVEQGISARKEVPLNWNSKKGQFELLLEGPSRVSLRAGIDNGPMMLARLNWTPLPKGQHRISWDGLDNSGGINLGAHPNLRYHALASVLPENTIFVSLDELLDPEYQTKNVPDYSDFDVSLSLIGANAQMKNDLLDAGKYAVEVKIDIPEPFRRRVYSSRNEVAVYVDGTFVYENEIAYLPFTYKLDTKNLSKGEHFITINVLGFDGTFGFVTRKFQLR